MTKKFIALICIMAIFAPSKAIGEPHSEAGSAGLSFLKIGVGARAVSMGEAFVGLSDDATALYWNPAGIGQLQSSRVTLMHAE